MKSGIAFHADGESHVAESSPDGKWRVKVVEGGVQLIDANSNSPEGKPLKTIVPPCWSFSPDSEWLAIGGGHKKNDDNWGYLQIWDLKNRTTIVDIKSVEGSPRFGKLFGIGFGKDKHDVIFRAERHRLDGP